MSNCQGSELEGTQKCVYGGEREREKEQRELSECPCSWEKGSHMSCPKCPDNHSACDKSVQLSWDLVAAKENGDQLFHSRLKAALRTIGS